MPTETEEYILGYIHGTHVILKTFIESMSPEDKKVFQENMKINRETIEKLFYKGPIINLSEQSRNGFDRALDGLFDAKISDPLDL